MNSFNKSAQTDKQTIENSIHEREKHLRFNLNSLRKNTIEIKLNQFRNNVNNNKKNKIIYRKRNFVPATFCLFMLTCIPLRFHSENFNLHILKTYDYCNNSLNRSFFSLKIDLNHTNNANENNNNNNNNNNIIVKYLTRDECILHNFTQPFNILKSSIIHESNSAFIFLCIDDVENLDLNELLIQELIVNSTNILNSNISIDSSISILTKVILKAKRNFFFVFLFFLQRL